MREKVCRYSLSVKKMKGKEQKVVYMRRDPILIKRKNKTHCKIENKN